MPDRENDRFAEIALEQRFCTAADIERCLRIQANTTEGLSLGQSLMREGFISQDQHSIVLKILRRGHRKKEPGKSTPPEEPGGSQGGSSAQQRNEDQLLGKLAVREGWLTQAELDQCFGGKKPGSSQRSLGEIMVARGYLDRARVNDLLARLSRRAMFCAACKAPFIVLSIAKSKEIDCPRCRRPLEEGKLPEPAPVADTLATQKCLKAVSAALNPPSPPKRIARRARPRSR